MLVLHVFLYLTYLTVFPYIALYPNCTVYYLCYCVPQAVYFVFTLLCPNVVLLPYFLFTLMNSLCNIVFISDVTLFFVHPVISIFPNVVFLFLSGFPNLTLVVTVIQSVLMYL